MPLAPTHPPGCSQHKGRPASPLLRTLAQAGWVRVGTGGRRGLLASGWVEARPQHRDELFGRHTAVPRVHFPSIWPLGASGGVSGEGSRLPPSPGVRGAWAGTRAMWSPPPPLPPVPMKGRRTEPGVAGRWSQPACFPARPALPSALCVAEPPQQRQSVPGRLEGGAEPGAAPRRGLAILSVQRASRSCLGLGGGTPCPLWGCPGHGHPDHRGSPAGFRPTVVCPEPRDDGAQPLRTLQEGLLGPRTADRQRPHWLGSHRAFGGPALWPMCREGFVRQGAWVLEGALPTCCARAVGEGPWGELTDTAGTSLQPRPPTRPLS